MEKLKYFVNNEFKDSKAEVWYDLHNPSTGEVTGHAPCCTEDEVLEAVKAAKAAYPEWKNTPARKRAAVLYNVRNLLNQHLDELTMLVCEENGKTWAEAAGDVGKAIEGTELATQAPSLMMGESLMDASTGFDTVKYREAMGVFAGIVPVNFPAMIPFGWMVPVCIACGNTIVLKAASLTPRTAMRIAELYVEAGVPKGVVNIVTCSRNEVNTILDHPDIKGVTFVGSTPVGLKVYQRAAASGKRCQALCQAKNHALVLEDCALERTVAGVINSAFGCGGQRCMALSCCVVQDSIADKFVAELKKQIKSVNCGLAWDKSTRLGPITYEKHYKEVLADIEKGINEGATLVVDGRNPELPKECKNGYFVGPTVFDNVSEDMTIGRDEVFGPVLCIKRVKNFDEGLELMNNNPYANGSVIYTQSGYYARQFARYTDGGQVGINVGIPVPVGFIPFSGHKQSFFGDLHCLGKDAYRFFTESKSVTQHWFDEEEMKAKEVDTWDGLL
ncbi:CoA-acylating methylmalonate-semialdehyde dehydrogenase [Eubacterium sp.]|uniref:CoA-acylating methylmalonate-semialdehyde dehydrogenase n=1 Tax=Eubacterium sp. TaxID=142586 RepID=UPI002A829D16|nr:CoA-acylating methylmalonate-semialdehyde dehydrogenase [Eubacterium sp.]MDY3811996.1 CoA-acylating methylmalonate-semialdehyde dehydrogenase [Eubacterium sp.]